MKRNCETELGRRVCRLFAYALWLTMLVACNADEPAALTSNDAAGSEDALGGADTSTEDVGAGDTDSPPDDVGSSNTPPDDAVGEDTAPDSDTPTGEMVAFRNLVYSPPPGVGLDLATLDVFRIDDGEVRPLVLLVHGGSWASGDKAGFEERFVPWFLEHGYVAAPVNFRLASKPGQTPVVKPGDQAGDIAAALAWLVGEADTYGIDPSRIVLLGYSSGAHLVALLGTDERYLTDVELEPSQVRGVISLDVHAYDVPYALELMVGSVVEQNIGTIRHLFGDTEEKQLEGSPISYVDGWAAPALVVSVDADPVVEGTHGYIVAKAAARYIAALQEAGHQAETVHDATETHSSLANGFGLAGDLTTETIDAFLSALPLPE